MENILECFGHKLLIPNIVDSQGVYLYDSEGKSYMDLESGVWCTSLGHKNIQVNNAIKKQIDAITHSGFCYSSKIVEKTAKLILSVTGLNEGKCVFLSSGSEAVEILRQAAKHITEKSNTLVLLGAELGAYESLTNRKQGWHSFEWENCENCTDTSICKLHEKAIKAIPKDVTEFIFEPGSSAGFVRFPPKALINKIVSKVKKNGGNIIVNEVTTGIGRTGKWFGYQHYNIQPDMVSIGKGIGNGYPVSIAVFSKRIAHKLNAFKYSQSHQNDPLATAVVNEVVSVIKDGNLIEEAEKKGEKFLAQLKSLESSNLEIRGKGLMFAIDLMSKKLTETIYRELIEKGYIVCNRGSFLRIDPPLIITEEQFSQFINTFSAILNKVTC